MITSVSVVCFLLHYPGFFLFPAAPPFQSKLDILCGEGGPYYCVYKLLF